MTAAIHIWKQQMHHFVPMTPYHISDVLIIKVEFLFLWRWQNKHGTLSLSLLPFLEATLSCSCIEFFFIRVSETIVSNAWRRESLNEKVAVNVTCWPCFSSWLWKCSLLESRQEKKKKTTKNVKRVFKYAKKLSFEGKLRGFSSSHV